jgi:hypothetical protein
MDIFTGAISRSKVITPVIRMGGSETNRESPEITDLHGNSRNADGLLFGELNLRYLLFGMTPEAVTIDPSVLSELMLSAAGSGTTCVKALQGVNGKRPGAFDLL